MLYKYDWPQLRALSRAAVFTPEVSGGEMIRVRFRTDPQLVAKVLPRPLRPTAEPVGVASVARYPQTNFGVPLNEAALFLQASYRGETGMYCLSMPVDDDTMMVTGREQFGFPKKMAEQITLDRDGGHVVGSVIRKGTEILRLEGEFADEVDLSRSLFGEPAVDPQGRPCEKFVSFLFKFFSSAAGDRPFEWAPLLVRQVTLMRPRPGVLAGAGKVVLTSTAVDPLGDIPVRDIVDATYGVFDNTMLPGQVVGRIHNPLRFAPYSMFKTDVFGILDFAELPQLGWRQRRRYRRQLAQY